MCNAATLVSLDSCAQPRAVEQTPPTRPRLHGAILGLSTHDSKGPRGRSGIQPTRSQTREAVGGARDAERPSAKHRVRLEDGRTGRRAPGPDVPRRQRHAEEPEAHALGRDHRTRRRAAARGHASGSGPRSAPANRAGTASFADRSRRRRTSA